MKKQVKKIKELKPKVKIVREINRGDKDLSELTAGEVEFSDEEFDRITESIPSVQTRAPLRAAGIPPTLEAQTARQQEEFDNRPLYDPGATSGEASEVKYLTAEDFQGPTMRRVDVGGDFAMGSTHSDHPEAARIEGQIRQGAEKKYEDGVESQGGKKKGHGYAWEN